MCKVMVFAGTTEGRELAEFLAGREIPAHICVATEYGEQLLPRGKGLEISHERLTAEDMESLMKKKGNPDGSGRNPSLCSRGHSKYQKRL